jgi:negative regulator of flagellin synthesis FlgM
MKIEHSAKLTNASLIKESRGTATRASTKDSEDVRLSSVASQLAASESEAPFDAGRVAEIKQAIAEGRFSINPGAIADRLIASAKELVGPQGNA